MILPTQSRLNCGVRVTLATAILFGVALGARADESFARNVPADVGLFVEARGANDLLTSLTEPRIWTTLAELAGQPSRPEEVENWRERIRQTVQMNPDEAIRVLFSRGVAFVGEGPGHAEDAVVVCRPGPDITAENLLKKWQAQPLDGSSPGSVYRLYSNIGVVERDGLLYFGDLLPAQGLLRRMQSFSQRPPETSLADDAVFKALLGRVGPDPDGLFFARLTLAAPFLVPAPAGSQPATQPTPPHVVRNLPGPFRGARNALVALHRQGPLLHFTAVGDGERTTNAAAAPLRFVEKLPSRTLLAWESRVDYAQLAGALQGASAKGAVEAVFQLSEQTALIGRFAAALGDDTCVAVGAVFSKDRAPDAPPLPAAALLIEARDTAAVSAEFRRIADLCVAGYSVFALTRGVPPLPPIRETSIGAAPAFVLDLSPLLKPTAKHAIGEVQCCWMIHRDALIVASHEDWLRQIVDAREGGAEDLTEVVRLSRGKAGVHSAAAAIVQPGPISDLGQLWLDYLARVKPEVLEENWWRDRQPGGRGALLGVNVTAEPENRRLRIDGVNPNQPADTRLKPGDYIVGYDNRRFADEDMVAEIQRAVVERPNARWMELLVDRGGPVQQKRLPIPFLNPVEGLERLVAIGRVAQRAVYIDERAETNSRGFLTVELRQSESPLFNFARPTPIGSTSAPAE